MANFNMHLGVAAVGSAMTATLCLGMGLAQPHQVVLLALLGTAGGLLPDLDLDHSSPTRLMFTLLGLLLGFLAIAGKAHSYSVLELWIVAGFCYLSVRYAAWQAFSDYTVHRGIFHSVAAALMFWFSTTALAYHLFDLERLQAWLTGFFVFLGYLIHLVLDEVYSVDFMNKRLKKSFGSALKLVDYKNHTTSALMSGAALLAFLLTPDWASFSNAVFDAQTWGRLGQNLWPQGGWFEL